MRGTHSSRHFESRSPFTQALALLAILTLVAPHGLLSPPRVEAQVQGFFGGFLELDTIFFSEAPAFGSDPRRFGPGETITVSGAVPFIPFCLGMKVANKGRGEGRFDFFPVADLYVIKDDGQFLTLFKKLEDVNGTPNRVTGLSEGAFTTEVVGITKPAGNLDAGRYDIVMDQCLDGVFDPGIDIVLGDGPGFAFEVVIPSGDLPPIDFSPLKKRAQIYKAILSGKDIEVPGDTPIEIPGFCKQFSKMVDKAKLKERVSPLASWAGIAIDRCLDLTRHWEGLAADPPDSNFTQFAELGPLSYDFSPATTPFERAMRTLAHVMAEHAATSRALLTSLERFQGAQQAGNDEFMVLQLEEANKFIDLLIGPGGSLLRFYAALEAVDLALRDDPTGTLPEAAELRAFIPEMRRGIAGLFQPLGASFRRVLAGATDSVVPVGLQAWIIVYLGLEPLLAGAGLPSILQVRAARGLPPIVFQHPTASSTGPYLAPPGRMVKFDASKSTDPNGDPLAFAWDLNSDGKFDDASTAVVERAFDQPGTRLVGLKATDPAGNTDAHYVLMKIGDLNSQDIVAMAINKKLYRISPNGAVTLLRPGVGLAAHSTALHVDLNGDILVLNFNSTSSLAGVGPLERYNADGVLLSTITREQVGNLVGVPIWGFSDFTIDGRGDIILLAIENLGPGIREFVFVRGGPVFDFATRFEQAMMGRTKIIRLAPDASRASALADVSQDYVSLEMRNGVLVKTDVIFAAEFRSRLAIDPEGKIVVGAVDALAPPRELGYVTVDPNDGTMKEVIPTSLLGVDPAYSSVTQFEPVFGGVFLGAFNFHFLDPGIGLEVDTQGNYIVGPRQGNPSVYRILIPPQINPLVSPICFNVDCTSFGVEAFPVLRSTATSGVVPSDLAIDSSGDYVIAAFDFASFPAGPGPLGAGIFRVTPVGELFKVADIGTFVGPAAFDKPEVLDVVPDVRQVTAKDIPPAPQVHLENLTINQLSCPGGAQLSVSLKNTGSGAVNDPVRVFFYDGDPEAGGVLIAAAVAQAPIAPGASVNLSAPWPNPGPGTHQVSALALGATNAPFKSFMVCVPAPPRDRSPIQLEPMTATNNLGSSHTLSATVRDIFGNPVSEIPITFDVTGANAASGIASTNAGGVATFTYAGTNAGQDNIVAGSFGISSNTASNTWQGSLADTTPPIVTCPAPTSVSADATGQAAIPNVLPAVAASDNVTPAASLTITQSPAAGILVGVGTHTIIVTVTDAAANSSTCTTTFAVLDTTAPVVTPPPGTAIPATEAGGARGNASAALAAFFAGGSAVDNADPAPTRLAPQVGGVDVDNNTLLPLGTTAVAFRFRDASSNVGTGAANLTVSLGLPRIAGTFMAKGRDASGAFYVDVRLTNTGTGNARNLSISQLPLRTLLGSGTVTQNTSLSPLLPLAIGNLDVGASTTIRLILNVPSTVTKFSVTESGPVQDVGGTAYSYSTAQVVYP